MQSYDVYLKEQKRFYQAQYRFFYSYLKHEEEASKDLEAFAVNLQQFIPGYSCEECMKPMFQELAYVVITAQEEIGRHVRHMTEYLTNIYTDDEIKAITAVYRQHKTLTNNIESGRQRSDTAAALQENEVEENQEFVKAAASFEYDRIRKMRQFCYQMGDSLTRMSAKLIEQCPELHRACGEINDFGGHLAVCQKFAGLDCGESIESVLGVAGMQEKSKPKQQKKEKPEGKENITQVVLHTGESPKTSPRSIELREEPTIQRESIENSTFAPQEIAAPERAPIVELDTPAEEHESTSNEGYPLMQKEPLRVPRFDFGDSLLEDADEEEGAAERLLRLNLAQSSRVEREKSIDSDSSMPLEGNDAYGLEALLYKQKQLEELEATLFPPTK